MRAHRLRTQANPVMGASLPQALDLVAHVIQLSVAPVFLLTAIAGLLGVLANRLARAVDRARAIEDMLREGNVRDVEGLREEHAVCARRSAMILRAIAFCVIAALLVCTVIVGLFFTAYYRWSPDLSRFIGTGFALALAALIVGLLIFLREVYIATASLRFSAAGDDPVAAKARTRRRG